MSIYSLDTLSADGFVRIAAEILGLFFGFTLLFIWGLGPLLQSAAPELFVQGGLDYSRTSPPDTALEAAHLLLSLVVVGGFAYWRLFRTEGGRTLLDDIQTNLESEN